MTNYARSDVYPPEVEALAEMTTCTDEAHIHGCSCGVGGDPILARCFLCDSPERFGRLVIFEGDTRLVCADCWARDEVRVPLDYSEAT